jgi:hypothetical protein
VKVSHSEYNLELRPDYGTPSTVQWYYFAVRNTTAGMRVRFNITNFQKSASLYQEGQKPLIYSQIEAERNGVGWRRAGDQVAYFQTPGTKRSEQKNTLTFTYAFQHSADTVFFAFSYPYTFTELQAFLDKVERSSPKHVRRKILCKSVAGNPIDMLTISSFDDDLSQKECVVISSRVHPGETISSFFVQGMITFLLSADPIAVALRSLYVFKIVPMMNPDGVICGNTRSDLLGQDLNRCYSLPRKRLVQLCPSVAALKDLISTVQKERKIAMYVDLHGHSRKMDTFMYGCENAGDPDLYLQERIFPRMLSEVCDLFSFAHSSFVVHKSKETCARVVVRRQKNIVCSYTLEGSLCGGKGLHYQIADMLKLGRDVCRALYMYASEEQKKTYLNQLRQELAANPHLNDEEVIGSDDDVEEAALPVRRTASFSSYEKGGASKRKKKSSVGPKASANRLLSSVDLSAESSLRVEHAVTRSFTEEISVSVSFVAEEVCEASDKKRAVNLLLSEVYAEDFEQGLLVPGDDGYPLLSPPLLSPVAESDEAKSENTVIERSQDGDMSEASDFAGDDADADALDFESASSHSALEDNHEQIASQESELDECEMENGNLAEVKYSSVAPPSEKKGASFSSGKSPAVQGVGSGSSILRSFVFPPPDFKEEKKPADVRRHAGAPGLDSSKQAQIDVWLTDSSFGPVPPNLAGNSDSPRGSRDHPKQFQRVQHHRRQIRSDSNALSPLSTLTAAPSVANPIPVAKTTKQFQPHVTNQSHSPPSHASPVMVSLAALPASSVKGPSTARVVNRPRHLAVQRTMTTSISPSSQTVDAAAVSFTRAFYGNDGISHTSTNVSRKAAVLPTMPPTAGLSPGLARPLTSSASSSTGSRSSTSPVMGMPHSSEAGISSMQALRMVRQTRAARGSLK